MGDTGQDRAFWRDLWDAVTRERPTRGYLEQSVGLVIGALALLFLHYAALGYLDVSPGDHGLTSVIAHIPREVGIALLIAAVLNFFVEKNTQRRHSAMETLVVRKIHEENRDLSGEINKDILTAVFGRNVGELSFKQIRERLSQPALHRVEAVVEFVLSLGKEANLELVTLKASASYVLANTTTIALAHKVKVGTASPAVFASRSKISSVQVNGIDKASEEFECFSESGIVNWVAKNEIIVRPGETLAVRVNYERAEYASGSEVICSQMPTECCRVVLAYPDKLKIYATPLHVDELESSGTLDGVKSWELKGLLPGQGMAIYWSPALPSSPPAVQVE